MSSLNIFTTITFDVSLKRKFTLFILYYMNCIQMELTKVNIIPKSSTPLNDVVLPPTFALSFTAIAKSFK